MFFKFHKFEAWVQLIHKYCLSKRMWKYDIARFLKILRKGLSKTFDHMWIFMIHAYSMLTLLYEMTSIFYWTKCFEDVKRYILTMQNKTSANRNVWNAVNRSWYQKKIDENSNEKRLYHHLNVLSRPRNLKRLFYFATFLTCKIPFETVKKSFRIVDVDSVVFVVHESTQSFLKKFIQVHELLSSENIADEFETNLHEISERLLDNHIITSTVRFKKNEIFVVIACIARFFVYRSLKKPSSKSIFRHAFEEFQVNRLDQAQDISQSSKFIFEILASFDIRCSQFFIFQTFSFAFSCLSIVLRCIRDVNILSLMHIYLVFLRSLITVEKAMTCVGRDIPWLEICSLLNMLIKSSISLFRLFGESFSIKNIRRPLPEDFVIRGQIYGQSYFPDTWFKNIMLDDEERELESASITEARKERILWLEFRLASVRLDPLCNSVTRLKFDSLIDGSAMITIFRLFRSYGMTQNLSELPRHWREWKSVTASTIK